MQTLSNLNQAQSIKSGQGATVTRNANGTLSWEIRENGELVGFSVADVGSLTIGNHTDGMDALRSAHIGDGATIGVLVIHRADVGIASDRVGMSTYDRNGDFVGQIVAPFGCAIRFI